MTTTRIELLRHGLPTGDECFRGHTDFALTDAGFLQMQEAVAACQGIDLVVTSPLKRCQRFALDYAAKQGIELIAEPDFKELNFGDWDGVAKQQVWQSDQEQLMKFWSSPWESLPPNGESLPDYDQRIEQAWRRLLTQYRGRSILLVTHGGVIKQLLRQLLEMPQTAHYLQRLNIPYAARVSISVYHDDQGKLWPEVLWPQSTHSSSSTHK